MQLSVAGQHCDRNFDHDRIDVKPGHRIWSRIELIVSAAQRFSLACLGFSFLFRGVQRGYFSFQRERNEIMKPDGLLISAEELPWRNPIFRLPITAK